MIHVALPIGHSHGWGIVGKFLVKEMSALTDIRLISDAFTPDSTGEPFEFLHFASLVPPGHAPQLNYTDPLRTAGPVLQCFTSAMMEPYRPQLRGTRNVGYSVFEDNFVVPKHVKPAVENFQTIVVGCNWCRDVLVQAGCPDVRTVLQGIDPHLFNPYLNEKEYFKDRFVIFSGGKMELRKGQDIAIRAYAVLQQRHKDVMLVNQWFNMFGGGYQAMALSKHIKYEMKTNDYFAFINNLLTINGIDLSRVVTLPPMKNSTLASIYKNSDVGLFPNRCEGATNLVMNEYMACGRPVIASFNTGHKDVLTDQNSLPIRTNHPFPLDRDGQPVALWEEPDLEETIEKLEWAYQNRDSLKLIGDRAGADQQSLTWRHTAEQFIAIMSGT